MGSDEAEAQQGELDRLADQLKALGKELETHRPASEAERIAEERDRFRAEVRSQQEELESQSDRLRIMEAKLQVLDASKAEDERLLRDEHAAEMASAEAKCTLYLTEFDAQRAELQAAEALESDLVEA